MLCKAVFGSLELLDDCLVIRRTPVAGFILHGLVGEKRIPYSSINAVQLKRAGVLSGYIQFTIGGGVESTERSMGVDHRQENTLNFTDNEAFEKARDLIERKIKESRSPQALVREISSLADQLDKLASLLERGLLTKEEFDTQKRSLLGSSSSSPAAREAVELPLSSEAHRMQAAMDRAIETSGKFNGPGATAASNSASSFGKRTASSVH